MAAAQHGTKTVLELVDEITLEAEDIAVLGELATDLVTDSRIDAIGRTIHQRSKHIIQQVLELHAKCRLLEEARS